MKKSIIYIFILFLISGCEQVLDKKELNSIDGRDIWNDSELANLYLNNVYNLALPTFSGNSNTNLSDESIGSGTDFMMYGLLTKESTYGIYSSNKWYIIRQLNTFFEGLNEGTMADEDKNLLLGQAHFLRAWTYWELVKYYGGVPLVLSTLDPTVYEDYQVARNSAQDCITQIIEDLEFATDLLPPSWPDSYGRITRSAAAALKGRVLLFYASPQFNPDNLQDRWQTAYDANELAIQMCEDDGHALYNDYASVFLAEAGSTEAILFTVFDNVNKYNGYESSVRPRSISNSTNAVGSAPNWDFVKSYPMYDGSPIKNNPEYDSAYFWKNRDPRFYATIAYNGMDWPVGTEENRVQWTYDNNTAEPTTIANGKSRTGFYLRKNIDNSISRLETVYGPTDWIEIRLAEVYLNFAECAAELGEIQTAKDYLMQIRKRAGIEAGSDGFYGIAAITKEDMIEAVMLERKIELAFEDKRHWDLRRRNMYINDLNNTPQINGTRRHGIQIELDTSYIVSQIPSLSGKEDSIYYYFENIIIDTIDLDTEYKNYFITTYNIELEQTDINFLQPKYNFYYVPIEELEKNTNMQQTIYWTDVEPFDPLAN